MVIPPVTRLVDDEVGADFLERGGESGAEGGTRHVDVFLQVPHRALGGAPEAEARLKHCQLEGLEVIEEVRGDAYRHEIVIRLCIEIDDLGPRVRIRPSVL